MQVSDLLSARHVDVYAASWAMASRFGELRANSNESSRGRDTDRGPRQNRIGHIMGVFGELEVMRLFGTSGDEQAARYIMDRLYDPRGGGHASRLDLRFINEDTGRFVGVDIKTFPCLPNRTHLKINERAHKRGHGRVDYYLFVLAPWYAKRVLISGLVPYADVSYWPIRKFRADAPGPRVCEYHDFTGRYCGGLRVGKPQTWGSDDVAGQVAAYRWCAELEEFMHERT